MSYPFRMYGRIIQVLRYQADYTRKHPDKTGALVDVPVTRAFPTQEEAEATGGVVTPLDTADYEWLDGIEVPDVPDPLAAAIEIYNMGQAAWQAKQRRESAQSLAQSLEQLRADIDYILLLEGV